MKKLLSVVLCVAMSLSLSIPAFAVDKTTQNPDNYDYYSIDFGQNNQVAAPSRSLSEAESRIREAEGLVSSLSLEDKGFLGLEEVFLDELQSLRDEGVLLKTYEVALPRSTEYYGSYDGFMFQAAYTTHTDYYSDDLYGKAKFEKFVIGALNIGMAFADVKYGIAYAAISSGSSPIITDSAVVHLANTVKVTARYIMIQDLNQLASLDKYSFVPVIMDQSRITSTHVVTYPGGAYSPPQLEKSTSPLEVPSPYFYNKNHNLSTGYNHYIAGFVTDPITYVVPPAAFSWTPPGDQTVS